MSFHSTLTRGERQDGPTSSNNPANDMISGILLYLVLHCAVVCLSTFGESLSSGTTSSKRSNDRPRRPQAWSRDDSPNLALLTEPDACDSLQRVEETIQAINLATRGGGVDLVVLRVKSGHDASNGTLKLALLRNLSKVRDANGFKLVVNDDVDIVLDALSKGISVDGVHVKEHNAELIPSIRSKLEHIATCAFEQNESDIIIGTSCHSAESASRSYRLQPRGPDYLFVGTCYLTQSHPEKQHEAQLEGPALPGRIKRMLTDLRSDEGKGESSMYTPTIFAIGGISESNCHEPVALGADGVATIRTVMQASDPGEAVERMKCAMNSWSRSPGS